MEVVLQKTRSLYDATEINPSNRHLHIFGDWATAMRVNFGILACIMKRHYARYNVKWCNCTHPRLINFNCNILSDQNIRTVVNSAYTKLSLT